MNAYGSASAGRNTGVANFNLNTTVVGSGNSTESTIEYQFARALSTPLGGKMIACQLAATSAAVSAAPSWNLTPSRILNVQVLPSSVGCGTSRQRSQTKRVVSAGLCRIDPHQHAVEWRHGVDGRVGAFPVTVEAWRRIGRDHVGQRATSLRRFRRGGRVADASGEATPPRAMSQAIVLPALSASLIVLVEFVKAPFWRWHLHADRRRQSPQRRHRPLRRHHRRLFTVITGLDPVICPGTCRERWPGRGPAMTMRGRPRR